MTSRDESQSREGTGPALLPWPLSFAARFGGSYGTWITRHRAGVLLVDVAVSAAVGGFLWALFGVLAAVAAVAATAITAVGMVAVVFAPRLRP